jgi:hypothetical protein
MKLGNIITNPLAHMLPILHYGGSSYRFGRGLPPGLEGKAPRWQAVNFNLASQASSRDSVDLADNFELVALMGSSNQAAGFRVQLFDVINRVKLQARGVNANLALGNGTNPFVLRNPYNFGMGGECLVIVQNMAVAVALIQVVLFGFVDDKVTAPTPVDQGLTEYGAMFGGGNRRPGGL